MLSCFLSYSRHAGSKDQNSKLDGDEERKPSFSRRLEHRASDRGEDYESDDDNDDDDDDDDESNDDDDDDDDDGDDNDDDDDDDDNDYNGDDDDDDENEVAEHENPNQTTRKLNPLYIWRSKELMTVQVIVTYDGL